MDTLTGVWTAFCGDSISTYNAFGPGKDSNSSFSLGSTLLAITRSSSCINHGFTISISLLLLFMLLFNFVQKGSRARAPATSQRFSPLEMFSAVFNGGLGLAYLGLGFWILEDKFREGKVLPLHQWLVLLVQGLTWIFLSFRVSLRSQQLAKVFVRVWSAITCLFAGFLCISSSSFAIINRKVSAEIVLNVLSLPGAVLLLLCAVIGSKHTSSDYIRDNTLYILLNGESDTKTNDSEERVTPFANAGLLSRLSFWWLNPLMKMGSEKPIEEKDIPHLGEPDRAESCYTLFIEQMNRQTKKKQAPSILWTLVFCHRREIVISGLFAFLKIITASSGPLLLNAFIEVAEGEEAFKYEGYVLAGTLFFAKSLESLSQRQWYFRTRRIGLQVRSLLSAAIYQKQLRLSNEAKMVHSVGEVMNYVTVDAYRIGEFPFWFHQTWTTSLQLVIALVILFHAVGLATISALIVIILTVLCNTPLAKLQHEFQTKLMTAQDKRLKVTLEALLNMKVLKLYAWDAHFKVVIEGLRKVEHKWLSAFQLRKAFNSFVCWTSPLLVSAAAFGTCYLLQIPLYASNVFTFVATLRLVQEPVRMTPDVVGVLIQAKVAFTRILEFLEAPELQNRNVRRKFEVGIGGSVFIKSANLSWEQNLSKPAVCNVNLDLKPGQKVAICGEVGSGKSTLLAAFLGEVPNIEGTKKTHVERTIWKPISSCQCKMDELINSLILERERERERERETVFVRSTCILLFTGNRLVCENYMETKVELFVQDADERR